MSPAYGQCSRLKSENSSSSAAAAARPLRSSSLNLAGTGLSRSSTPTSWPACTKGSTISDRDAASHAMCPGNSCTSGTTKISRRSADAASQRDPHARDLALKRSQHQVLTLQEVVAHPVHLRQRLIEQGAHIG